MKPLTFTFENFPWAYSFSTLWHHFFTMSCKNALLLFYNVIDIRRPKMPSDLPTEGMWAFGIGRRNVNPCCGRFIPNPQLAGTWPLGADANCIINVSFILQSLIGLLCICVAWPPYDVTAGDWGSFTLQQLIAEFWFSIGLYPEQFCSGLILGGYGTRGECITLDPDIKLMQTKIKPRINSNVQDVYSYHCH